MRFEFLAMDSIDSTLGEETVIPSTLINLAIIIIIRSAFTGIVVAAAAATITGNLVLELMARCCSISCFVVTAVPTEQEE